MWSGAERCARARARVGFVCCAKPWARLERRPVVGPPPGFGFALSLLAMPPNMGTCLSLDPAPSPSIAIAGPNPGGVAHAKRTEPCFPPPDLHPGPLSGLVVAPDRLTTASPAVEGTIPQPKASAHLHTPSSLRSASGPVQRAGDPLPSSASSHPASALASASAHANPLAKSGLPTRDGPAASASGGGGGGKRKHLTRLMLQHLPSTQTASAPVSAQEPDRWLGNDENPNKGQLGNDLSHRSTTRGPTRPPATPATPTASLTPNAQQRWQALKKHFVPPRPSKLRTPSKPKPTEPNLVQELGAGILPVMLLKMSLDKDESGDRRVPVLLHHLRTKVTDSLVAGVQAGHAIFRIELS